MTTEILSIVSGAGAGTIICVLMFYFWLKKIVKEDIVKPMIEPLETKINDLKENHNTDIRDINKKLDKIDESLSCLTKEVTEMTAIFKIITQKFEVKIKN